MQLKKFTLPKADERLITIDNAIFKIKIILVKEPKRNEKSYEDFCSNPKNQEEIEKIITILLTSKDDLQPIQTDNLTVYLYRSKWKLADALQFYRNKIALKACPYNNNFYIQPKLPTLGRPNHNIQKQSTKVPFQNSTEQTAYHSQADIRSQGDARAKYQGQGIDDEKCSDKVQPPKRTENPDQIANHSQADIRSQRDARAKYQGQEIDDGKCSDKVQPPKTTENPDQITILEPVSKHKELPPKKVEKADNGTESESEDNQSVSILDGLQPYGASSPVNLGTERMSDDSEDESAVYSMTRNEETSLQSDTRKQDMKAKIVKCRPIELISSSEVKSQTRKRRGEVLEEAEPRKKNYSVTEYVDMNRDEVQDQDLQELLRYQELATPVEEKPAIEKRRKSHLQRMLSSVTKMVFGSE